MVQKILIFNFFFLLFFLSNNFSNAKVIEGRANIIDGDTIHINKNKIRLHGIDAPETKQKCLINNKEWSCGKNATKALKKIISDQIVNCKIIDKDKYNRLIGICFANNININKKMVRNGWAIAYRYYSKDYIIDENIAKKKKIGIWVGTFEDPYYFRKKNK